jgi:hypothetical protein
VDVAEDKHDDEVTTLSDIQSGPYLTTSIYNASVVNFYNATGSLANFES